MTHTKKKADSAEDVEIPKHNNKQSLFSSNHHTISITPKGFIFLRFFCARNLPLLSRLDNTDVYAVHSSSICRYYKKFSMEQFMQPMPETAKCDSRIKKKKD